MATTMKQFYWLLVVLIALPCAGQIYKTVDQYGNVSYSDSPPEDASNTSTLKLKLGPVNSTPAIKIAKPGKSAPASPAAKPITIRISSPQDQANITAEQRNLRIQTSIIPALPEGAQIIINLDGQDINAGADGSVTIYNIHRGEHRIYAKVSQAKRLLAETATTTIYVFRPHL